MGQRFGILHVAIDSVLQAPHSEAGKRFGVCVTSSLGFEAAKSEVWCHHCQCFAALNVITVDSVLAGSSFGGCVSRGVFDVTIVSALPH